MYMRLGYSMSPELLLFILCPITTIEQLRFEKQITKNIQINYSNNNNIDYTKQNIFFYLGKMGK